jgi:glycosyltransferase involved in cell wall biosynthesis
MKVLIIVPAYNEEKNLPRLFARLREECPDYDVVVVNDCSKDRTLDVCSRYGVSTINLPVNLGIGGAVQSGYKYAFYNKYDAAVQVDGDGQHDPKYISQLVKEIEKGYSLCIGSRFINMEGFQSTVARRAGIKFFSALIYLLTGQAVKDPTSGFRACDFRTIELFARDYPRDYPEPETIVNVSRNNLTITEIPVLMGRREEGKSSITSSKSIYYMIKVSLAILIASLYKHGSSEVKDL